MSETDQLRTTVKAFCCFIEGLSESERREQEWGPKEVLAHLVFHHESYLAQVEGLLSGKTIALPQGCFRDLNAQAVSASRGVPIEELLSRFQRANQAICRFYEGHDPYTMVVKIKQGAKPRTLAELIPEVEAHIRNHHWKLEKQNK